MGYSSSQRLPLCRPFKTSSQQTKRTMKQNLTPSTGRERPSRAQTTPILIALAIGWLGMDAPLALTQDDTLPLAANVDQLRVTVGVRSVPVSYARIDAANRALASVVRFPAECRLPVTNPGGSFCRW